MVIQEIFNVLVCSKNLFKEGSSPEATNKDELYSIIRIFWSWTNSLTHLRRDLYDGKIYVA